MASPGSVLTDPAIAVRDQFLAPSLLGPFAEDMAQRIARLSMGPYLEVMADTGTLTLAVASAISAGMTIVATDPDPAVISHASGKAGMARVRWQQADPYALPFKDATFGIVACHFGVVGLSDRVRAYTEARRVAKPGGRFVFSVPSHLRHNPVAGAVQDALREMFPADPPRFIGRVLHGYADNETIDDDLTAAGFTDAIYSSVELPFAAASAHDVAAGYCLGTPLRLEIEARAPGQVQRVAQAVAAVLETRFGTGLVEAGMRAHIVSASG
jgi:ubiquinone/menaquinone biosynthesis C-methylase UbiE